MKKVELLAPAGSWDNMVSAVMAGADAVYLGGIRFGARAFSSNFSDESIVKAIKYCHLYGVKVYVTVNTLIYDNEVDDFINYIRFLHKNNVDAILIQDIGMLDLVRKKFPNLEVHSSTQMHIHNLDGTLFMEKMGVKRVVLARETSVDEIKYIKENSNVELEVFVHGALCICYSGQCLMSSLIGGRSGNRGECAGSCRLNYDVIDSNGNVLNKDNKYPLSTRDLYTLKHIDKLIDIGVSSLKIEGRMKSREYVYMVVRMYRHAIDSYYKNKEIKVNLEDEIKLKKIFNRNYTSGFLFNTKNNDLMNTYRPNHMGVSIGKVIDYKNNIATILLTDTLSIGSGLRIIGNKDVGVNVNDFYINNKLVKTAYKGDKITIKVNDIVKINSDVVITLDSNLVKSIDNEINNLRRINITCEFNGYIGNKMSLMMSDGVNNVICYGNIIEKSINNPTSKEIIYEKLNKLNDTVYKIKKMSINIDDNIFIPLKELNELRRNAIDELNNKRLYKIDFIEKDYDIEVPNFKKEKLISVCTNSVPTIKYDVLYSEILSNAIKVLPRVIKEYPNTNENLLVGEIGAFNKYKNACTDYSFNVVNSYSVSFLHSIGASRVCLSYELNDEQISNLINSYKSRYKKCPNLELIVSGYEEVMISKFSLKNYYGKDVNLKDRFNNIYKIKEENGLMHIYNYKKRDIYKESYYDMGINCLRFYE